MSNLQARANNGPLHDFLSETSSTTTQSYPALTKLVSTVALLILGYYVVSVYDAWPSTLKRSAFEITSYLLPSRIIYAMQYGLVRLGRLSYEDAKFRREDFGDLFAKQEALKRILGQQPMPFILHRVRSLSSSLETPEQNRNASPPGLGNWDNSCYQNSILQGLASLPAFFDYLETSLEQCEKYEVEAETHRALVAFLEQLVGLSHSRTVLWTPKILKSMDSWQQQDAQEYFSRVLEAIEKEAVKSVKVSQKLSHAGLDCLRNMFLGNKTNVDVGAKEEESLVNRPMTQAGNHEYSNVQYDTRNPLDGLTAQTLKCTTCGFTEGLSLTQSNCLTLNLGLRGSASLEELLDEFTTPEEVDGVECERCTKMELGNGKVEDDAVHATNGTSETSKPKAKPVLRTKLKQITLGRLPKDLVLHINRSIFDDFGNQKKNSSPIKFPTTLNFQSRWCAPLEGGHNQVEAVYELKCVVTHYGRHDNGHYIALGKRGKNWYSFNDERVNQISEEEVLSYGNGFMFFYEAVAQTRDREGLLQKAQDATVPYADAHASKELPDVREDATVDANIIVDPMHPGTVAEYDLKVSENTSPSEASSQEIEQKLDAGHGVQKTQDAQDVQDRIQIPTLRTASSFLESRQDASHLVNTPIVQSL